MSDIERLLREGVDTAYELQAAGSHVDAAVRERVIKRGRRRRALRGAASAVLSVALVAGAASAGAALLRREGEVAGRAVPDMGAERVLAGGAAATDGRSLWVGDGAISNTRGDENSIARMDLASGEVVDGPPAVEIPHALAWGETGLWSTAWTGDMPVGGEGHPVSGVIERVDPQTLERTGRIAREDSAPYDVAVGQAGGREVVWVVDYGRHELLEIDGETMEIAAVHETPRDPASVHAHGRFVYVTSSTDHLILRIDTATRAATEIPVPDCANDVAVAYGSLWVADYCGDALLRIDEGDSADVVSIDIGEAPTAVEVAEGLIWVATQDAVVRVDPAADEVVGNRIFVTKFFMGGLLYAGGDVWVHGSDGVYRLGEDVPPATPPPAEPTEDPRDEPVPEGAERVDVRRHPRAVAVGPAAVWTGEWEIERLDPSSGERLGTADAGGFVNALRYDEDGGLLWALVEIAEKETSAVAAVDPESDEVVLSPVAVTPSDVSGQHFDVREGTAWVPGRGGILSRVHASEGDVTEIDLSQHFDETFDEEGSFHVAATDDCVLVLSTDGVVVRVDPATGEHEKVEDIGWNVADVESDGSSVWVARQSKDGDVELWTLDGRTGRRRGEPVDVARFGYALLSEHGGMVWVVRAGTGDLLLEAYAGGAGDPVRELRLPGGGFTTDVDAGESGVWVTTGESFLYRIPPG
jgi:streptogramin lyase